MSSPRERIERLLVDEATGNLSAAESHELERLLREYSAVDSYAFQRAASAVFLAGAALTGKSMPVSLTAKIIAAGEKVIAEQD